MLSSIRLRLYAPLFVAAFALTACDCNPVTVKKAKGTPEFINPKSEPGIVVAENKRTLDIDFGPTLVNQDKANTKTVTITNSGLAVLELVDVIKKDPFNNEVFKIPSSSQVKQSITPGTQGSFTVGFSPVESGDFTSSFSIRTDADETGEALITVNLKGQGVSNGCILSPTTRLDFGNVKVNSSYTKKMVVQNTTPIDWVFTYRGIAGADSAYFTSSISVGEHVIKARESLEIPIVYTANRPGVANAFVQFESPAEMCEPQPYDLRGTGVESLITAEPNPVDFGFVDPGVSWGAVTRTVKLTNLGNDAVTLSTGDICDGAWAGSLTAACVVTSEFANNPDGQRTRLADLTIASGASVDVPLYFKPARLHNAKGHVRFSLIPDTAQASFGFDLAGVGGGPKIQVAPLSLDYGVVGIGAPQSRSVVITNIGSSIAAQDASKLQITALDIVADTGTTSGEFSQAVDLSDRAKSLLAATGRLVVPVRFDPASVGVKGAKLRVSSNDPINPVVEVTLRADGQQLPPCTYAITPPTLNFGNVQPGRNRVLSFRIANKNATGPCSLSALDLGADTTNPPFSLVDGPVASKILNAGESLDVEVKFAPTAAQGNYTGSVRFFTSSAAAPEGIVTLSGGSSPACVLITPDDVDFGVVQTGCASRERTFTMYNVCNSDVTVTGLSLLPDSAGLCPDTGGARTCPFRLTRAITLPATISPGGSVEFKMKYQPDATRTDVASVAVQTQQLTQPYVVTLQGRGDSLAVQTDIYRQDAQPKVDVLLTVDDSGSMSDKQAALGQNFSSFIQFAISQQVDYHIAVTSTSTRISSASNCGTPGSCGTFSNAGGVGIITNSTPNISSAFASNVNVGTNGDATEMGFQAAYEALTAPNITGPNNGFLREEANLAIISVSDAADQSPNSFSFYQNFFLNIKGFRRANAFTYSTITSLSDTSPSPGTCSYDGTNDNQLYAQMAQATNGVVEEICTPDWSTSLRSLSQSAFGYRTRFFLTETPDTAFAIEVKIDGVPFPATTPRGAVNWSFNTASNAIDFAPLAVPEPGSTLSISYHVLCYPTVP